ncbi:tetratricopeptide repeat protein [Desulforhopalus singaporensis]|uniref:Tetratricopeptide repeat-containing protein n=1 Tax=Desulforhopalus singaporensis TaxID=91360 RepID=A0A1H0MHX8_9BACT|nr:tetratricopeptide repeat protein [Desulforhopalus singaporensis]SDO79925.1 Tetratricopeptide repeat-containing protein [Desulforhopalus singaporensis]
MKFFSFAILCLTLVTGCGRPTAVLELQEPQEQTDYSCSYFYFLWATHAEYSGRYPEALEAYEKALICDPSARYIEEKIPIVMFKMGDFEAGAAWLLSAIEAQPDNDTFKLFLANLYVQQDKLDAAIGLYRQVLDKNPANEAVQIRLGLLHTHLKNYDEAETIFRKLLQTSPTSYLPRLCLARLLKERGRYDESITQFEQALDLNWSKEIAFELGFLYVDRQKYSEALRIYAQIIDQDEFDEQASLSRIQALFDLGRYDDALGELYRLRDFSSAPDKIDLIISKVYLGQNRPDKARPILLRLTRKGDAGPEAAYMLALIYFQQQQYGLSLELLKQITPHDEEFEEAVYLQTRIYQKTGDSRPAINNLLHYIADDQIVSPLFFALLSSLYQERDEPDKAVEILKEGVLRYPDDPQILFEYGLLLEKTGRHQVAMKTMQQVLKLQADHAEALNFIGYTWADNNVNLDKALEYIEKANRLKPDNGFIIDSLGWVYFRLGRYREAEEAFQHSLTLESGDPNIYEHLGRVYQVQDKHSQALEMFQRAVELFGKNAKKKKLEKEIEALKQLLDTGKK